MYRFQSAGVTDHNQLTNIGSRTHDQLEQDILDQSNDLADHMIEITAHSGQDLTTNGTPTFQQIRIETGTFTLPLVSSLDFPQPQTWWELTNPIIANGFGKFSTISVAGRNGIAFNPTKWNIGIAIPPSPAGTSQTLNVDFWVENNDPISFPEIIIYEDLDKSLRTYIYPESSTGYAIYFHSNPHITGSCHNKGTGALPSDYDPSWIVRWQLSSVFPSSGLMAGKVFTYNPGDTLDGAGEVIAGRSVNIEGGAYIKKGLAADRVRCETGLYLKNKTMSNPRSLLEYYSNERWNITFSGPWVGSPHIELATFVMIGTTVFVTLPYFVYTANASGIIYVTDLPIAFVKNMTWASRGLIRIIDGATRKVGGFNISYAPPPSYYIFDIRPEADTSSSWTPGQQIGIESQTITWDIR